MASTNNWLGFSLFPNHHHHHHHHQEISDGRAGSTDEGCFDLPSAVPTAINLSAAPFGILEAFNRGNQTQDWNMKGSSELSMLIGSSCNAANHHEEPPKLENFLGGSHCFAENTASTTTATTPQSYNHGGGGDHYNMFTNSSSSTTTTNGGSTTNNNNNGDSNNNGFNVSLIKTWLGNLQPAGAPTTDHQSGGALSLSMMSNTGSHESALPLLTAAAPNGGGGGGEISERSLSNHHGSDNNNKACNENGADASSTAGHVTSTPKKCIDTFGQRTSIYRGVTRHRWTGRYEAHLWDNSCRREGQTRKGRQVYLGGYDKEEKAARSYDLAAIKYWGTTTTTNFPISNYEKEVDEMKNMTRQEYIASLRRKSSGFSRGASIYRGVTRHHQQGRWQARIGRVAGNKDLYLGTFTTQEEAAEAYDIAAIKFRGLNAVTNFEINRYDVKSILESSTLPIGGAAKRLKDADALITSEIQQGSAAAAAADEGNRLTSQLTANNHQYHHGMSSNYWPAAGVSFQQAQALASVQGQHYGYSGHQRLLPWCKQESDCTDTNGNHHHHHHLLPNQNHGFHQDVNSQVQPGHNYLYHYNLMGLDGPSLEQSSGSDPVMYGGGGENGNAVQYGSNGGGGYGLPMATTTVVGHAGNGTTGAGFGETDVNFYYQLSQQSSPNNGHVVKSAVGYDQSSAACNHWIPTAVPALASKTNSLPVCQGALPFTVWN